MLLTVSIARITVLKFIDEEFNTLTYSRVFLKTFSFRLTQVYFVLDHTNDNHYYDEFDSWSPHTEERFFYKIELRPKNLERHWSFSYTKTGNECMPSTNDSPFDLVYAYPSGLRQGIRYQSSFLVRCGWAPLFSSSSRRMYIAEAGPAQSLEWIPEEK